MTFADGRISLKNDPSRGETYAEILRRNRMDSIEATVDSKPGDESKKFSMHAFCAHFIELRVDAELGIVRVSRIVSACGAGRIMNEKTAHSQLSGGIVGGLGMALTEETVMDHRMGRYVNANFGEYHVPVNADVPAIRDVFCRRTRRQGESAGCEGNWRGFVCWRGGRYCECSVPRDRETHSPAPDYVGQAVVRVSTRPSNSWSKTMTESQSIVDAYRGLDHGQRAALATVVALEGSSYRRPGARMLITENGDTTGVLSGGCLEHDVSERALNVMRTGEPVVVRYDTTNEDDIIWGLGLGCNGIVDILIEPANTEYVAGLMQLLAECADSDSPGAVATVFHVEGNIDVTIGARAQLYPDGTVDGDLIESIFDDLRYANSSSVKRYEVADGYVDVFLEVIQPRPRLVIFGAGYDALPVVDLAKRVGWHTTVVDTRARASSRERFSNADLVLLCRPEDVLDQVRFTERTAVVTMTHNYLHDLELLRNLLPLPLRYLGCLGPRRRTERLLLELTAQDERLANEYLRQLHAPIGLDIGAETAAEIALSTVSEIKAVLADRSGAQLRQRTGNIHLEPTFVASSRFVHFSERHVAVCEV